MVPSNTSDPSDAFTYHSAPWYSASSSHNHVHLAKLRQEYQRSVGVCFHWFDSIRQPVVCLVSCTLSKQLHENGLSEDKLGDGWWL